MNVGSDKNFIFAYKAKKELHKNTTVNTITILEILCGMGTKRNKLNFQFMFIIDKESNIKNPNFTNNLCT
ncbi:hypothetical protein B7P43_G15560 [Cryptotermes secundus]|uniref:Uncharacterized protein n=1 Tax=Cryptotermes secundus TaxID=105785 RepID=A0A2J7PMI8_9NEOP|nr:hypothetical protein B7P43_G15560 [Cryptotermes secundus]